MDLPAVFAHGFIADVVDLVFDCPVATPEELQVLRPGPITAQTGDAVGGFRSDNRNLKQPCLTGERTPHPDPLARGAFVGLTVRHTRLHLTRAVLEGVAFGLRDSFELIKSAGLAEIRQVRASGGGAKSALWLSILADVLGVELVTVNTTEGAAYAAALLAAVGAGVWADVASACRESIHVTGVTAPRPDEVDRYERHYAIYRDLYPALKALLHRLGAGDLPPRN